MPQATKVRETPIENQIETPVEVPRRRLVRNVNEYSPVMREMPECTNPYVAFAPKPRNVHFESQSAEETIILFVRRHFITQLGWIIAAILLFLAPFFLQFIPLLDFFPERFHIVILAGWYTFLLGFILENFLVWFFNVNIFTDERIVDIDFYSLLYKKITTAQIDRVEDVTSTTGGFLGSLLNYGNVDIQTAANARELSFEEVPSPEKIVQILNDLIMEEERERLEGRAR